MTIKGDTVDDVEDLLINFRIINGRPLGNPRQEIIDYYAEKYPWMVEFETEPEDDKEDNHDYTAWKKWIASVWGKPAPKFITRIESGARLAVCKTCPHSAGKPWEESRESIEFSRKALLLRRGEQVPENICYCRLHRADASVGSFLESPADFSNKPQDVPSHPGCWFLTKGTQ